MPRKPNVLLITSDQLRADVLGCYGNAVCRTPHLDALAAGGVLFEKAYTPNPICVPARATLTTGNYPHLATGKKGNVGRIGDEQVKLAEHFGGFGYRTYALGKLHYVPYSPPDQPRLVHGFDVWDSCESGRVLQQFDPRGERRGVEDYFDFLSDCGWHGYTRAHGIGNNDVRPCPSPLPEELNVDHWVADRTIQRLREHVRGHGEAPFLAWCSFPKPHSPYDPPAAYASLYDPREVPAPAGDASLLEQKDPEIESTRITHAHDSLSPQALRVIKAYYYGLTTFHDVQVGRVLAVLEELGLAEDTIVIYTADHGDLMGDFGAFFKAYHPEGAVRVPLIVRTPGGGACGRRAQLAGLQDVLPTLAALTDCPLPGAVQGLDLSAALADARATTRELFYAQCQDSPRQSAMVTDGRWKYCWAQRGGVEELYDLQADPQELVNLALRGGFAPQTSRWRRRLMDEAGRLGDTGLFDASGEELASSPLDRKAIRSQPVGGMGWRWY